LLRRIATGEQVEITEGNRPTFRELADARIIDLMRTFTRGAESGYRFTRLGWEQRFELIGGAKAEAR
jgi:antitoxin (DNA-binding transcriptional repressor) of toxin-antitoxin stability system